MANTNERSSLNMVAPKEAPKPQTEVVSKVSQKDEIISKIVDSQPSVFKMLRTSLFTGTVEQAKEHVLQHIFEPDIKAMLFNGIVAFMSVWVFGDDRSRRANSVSSYYRSSLDNGSRDYATMAKNAAGQNAQQKTTVSNPSEVKDIVFETHAMAEQVRADVLAAIEENGGYISVYKYYELCHLKMTDLYYPQKDWGWVNLDKIDIYQDSEGFHLDVPRRATNLRKTLAAQNNRMRY